MKKYISIVIISFFLALIINYFTGIKFHYNYELSVFIKLYWPLFAPFIAGAIGGALPAFALWFAMKSFKVSQERLRREKAIDAIRNFNSSYNLVSRSAYRITENLNDEQLLNLNEGRPFSIKEDLIGILELALQDGKSDATKITSELTEKQSFQIRCTILELLNSIEIVCATWVYDVSNSDIIKEEIKFLYDPSERNSLLERFRHITHSNIHYPNIVKFTNFIKSNDLQKSSNNILY